MPDLASFSAILSSVKTATDLAKIIKSSDISLADAETKLKVAELISALADVKLELADVQESLRAKDLEIHSLKKQLTDKATLKYDGQLYWAEDDNVPFCPVCKEKDEKYHHLTYYPADHFDSGHFYCKVCKNSYRQNT